jgi:uncharacterized protein YggE
MRISLATIAVVAFGLTASAAKAQGVDISAANKAIEVTVTEKIQVDPDIARITLGVQSFGATHDTAFQENVRVADEVLKALMAAGLKKEDIETHKVSLDTQDADDLKKLTLEVQKARRYVADQTWNIRVAAENAQKVLEAAIRAGANKIAGIVWDVSDPAALNSRALAAALEKARRNAQEIATGLGGKLGGLIYASNSQTEITYVSKRAEAAEESEQFVENFSLRRETLQLFPEKIERDATVHAVFALQ